MIKKLKDFKAKRLIQKRKQAFKKWKHKFDSSFKNHLSGDAGWKKQKVLSKEWEYIEGGQGGHYLNKYVKIRKVKHPPNVSNIKNDIPKDMPYKAEISIKSKHGSKEFKKLQESSMFPHNWDEARIQEEVALVYENTVGKGQGKLPRLDGDKFDKYQAKSTSGFDILIEVDANGNIVNAYPII